MPRKNPERRQEFITAAQRLFLAKGYENTSVNDLIKAVGVSKGAFYHHFISKQAVLEAIVEELMNDSIDSLQEIIDDQTLPAIAKCQRAIQLSSRWKLAPDTQLIAVRRLLRTDANILMFHKLSSEWRRLAIPRIATIIRQGISEGVFEVAHIPETASILITLTSTLTDEIADIVAHARNSQRAVEPVKKKLAALQTAVERLLGAPSGSITIIDEKELLQWLHDSKGGA